MFPPQPQPPEPDKPWEPERFLSSDAHCCRCYRWVPAEYNRWTWMVIGNGFDDLELVPVHNDCLTCDWELRLPDEDRWR